MYVCTEVETVQSNMNLVKQRVTAFILIMSFFAQPTPSQGPKPNFTTVHMKATEREVGEGAYKCYMYTPANLDSYGFAVQRKNVHFEVCMYALR